MFGPIDIELLQMTLVCSDRTDAVLRLKYTSVEVQYDRLYSHVGVHAINSEPVCLVAYSMIHSQITLKHVT